MNCVLSQRVNSTRVLPSMFTWLEYFSSRRQAIKMADNKTEVQRTAKEEAMAFSAGLLAEVHCTNYFLAWPRIHRFVNLYFC